MRHPLHSICPYFAMFPEQFVAKQLLAYTERGDTVFDPFCGRGTTVFESLLNGRHASGVDINPVAACIAGAKADAPRLRNVKARLAELKIAFPRQTSSPHQGVTSSVSAFMKPPCSSCSFSERRLIGGIPGWTDLSPRSFSAPYMANPTNSKLPKQPHAPHDQHEAGLLGSLVV